MVKVNCPSCGGPVTFQSTFSILAVCEHCNSTLIRHDINVEDIGKMATLQVDASPIQLGTRGEYRNVSFTVVGRIQLRFDRGLWNEWHLTFNDGRSGWLGEAQGTYAVSFQKATDAPIPAFENLRAGKTINLHNQTFTIQDCESARCIAGQGELPFQIEGGYEAPVADLLGDNAAFATIDYSEEKPLVFIGEYVDFNDLRFSNLRDVDSWSNTASPKVKAFQCVRCGAAMTQRAMLQTTTVVCPNCGAIVDVSNEELRILSEFTEKTRVTQHIPLGVRGKFEDGEFEVLGFLRRYVTVEGVNYWWREYLLFNPFKGFRWLSEYNGHWSYIRTTMNKPQGSNSTLLFNGEAFLHFQSAIAKVDYVIGEFYWQVKYGEAVLVSDYVAPPQIFSVERADNEVTYSVGTYMEPGHIARAFNLKTPLPLRIGVGANQPSPIAATMGKAWNLAVAFVAIALAIQIASIAFSQNKLVYQTSLPYNATDSEKSRVSGDFELSGRTSNVMIKTRANVNNAWLYLNMALINEETGTAYDFGREIDYYYGTDSDGAWTEGQQSDEMFLPSVPSGRYYLRLEPEGPTSASYSIQVYRDVPRWWLFLATVLLIFLFPFFIFLRNRSFEYKRWSESDHPMKNLFAHGDD